MSMKPQITIPISNPLVTLTTDYGWTSEGIGVIKATILNQNVNTLVIDLCHTVDPFSILNGCRQFEMVRYFPIGIHVVVVDPGVGSNRRPVILTTKRGDYLIGPDNGVLLNAAQSLGGIESAYQIKVRIGKQTVFDGRDVFGHVAGLLAKGDQSVTELGEKIEISTLHSSPLTDNLSLFEQIEILAIHINHFGSVIVNVKSDSIDQLLGKVITVRCGKHSALAHICRTFSDVPIGSMLLCDDGYGRFCIAINQGSANKMLNIKIGSVVQLKLFEE